MRSTPSSRCCTRARRARRWISCCRRSHPAAIQPQAKLAIGNCLAQAEAFAYGYSLEQATAELAARKLLPERVELLARHKVHAGNRPVSIIAFQRLDARTLGSLVALYEHKVFTQSVLWGINAFDQWGVELGKKMCEEVLPLVRDPGGRPRPRPTLEPLLTRLRAWQQMSAASRVAPRWPPPLRLVLLMLLALAPRARRRRLVRVRRRAAAHRPAAAERRRCHPVADEPLADAARGRADTRSRRRKEHFATNRRSPPRSSACARDRARRGAPASFACARAARRRAGLAARLRHARRARTARLEARVGLRRRALLGRAVTATAVADPDRRPGIPRSTVRMPRSQLGNWLRQRQHARSLVGPGRTRAA